MQGLSIRMAKAVNRALGGRGQVFPDRYDAHELKTPRETRNALLYVLQNWAKHGTGGAYDPLSSATPLDGWSVPPPGSTMEWRAEGSPQTWLGHCRLAPVMAS